MKRILDKDSFRRELEQIARASGRPLKEVRAEALRDLDEMRAARSSLAEHMFAGLSRFVYRRGYHKQAVYDLDELETVRRESGNRSIVFLVTHKT